MSNKTHIGLGLAIASLLTLPTVAGQLGQTPAPPPPAQTTQAQTPQNPCPQPQAQGQTPAPPTNTDVKDQGCTDPKANPADSGQSGSDQSADQQKTVHPKNSKEDVDAIGNRNVGKGVNFYSLEREIALGKQLAQEVERTSKMIDDPVVTEYVNRVGQNLVRNSDAQVPFTIKVIDSDEVNAFALPGGFFYVNSGLILRAQEESELAGVMAHEISHVAA